MVSAKRGKESEDALSEFPAFDAAQALPKRTLATSLPPHVLVGTDRDEEDGSCDDGLVDETTAYTRIAIRGKGDARERRACAPVVF